MKPIKRHPALQPLSRDHHEGLLLCWKIKEGLKKNFSPDRIADYAQWFYKTHLKDHFKEEEQNLFTVTGIDKKLIDEALEQHKLLNNLFLNIKNEPGNLSVLSEELEKHIRFEERILFNVIQEAVSEEWLENYLTNHSETKSCEIWHDQFWV